MKILVISDAYPMPDIASGHLRFFRILNALAKSHQVVVCAHRSRAQASHYGQEKFEKAREDLKALGVEPTEDLRSALRSQRYDCVFFEFYKAALEHLSAVRVLQPGAVTVVDSVDVHYSRFRQKAEVSGRPEDHALAEAVRKIELATYSRAEMVIAVTEDDAGVLRQDRVKAMIAVISNIHAIPSRVEQDERKRNAMLFVGGFQHEPNVDGMLYFCSEILPRIRKVIPDVCLNIVGSYPPEAIRSLNGDGVEVVGYVPETDPYLRAAWVSVAPLRFGAGMKGKVGEAMSFGLPVVATSVGAEGFGLTPGEHALVADDPDEFAQAVIRLMSDDSMHHRIGQSARRFISERYGEPAVAQRVTELFQRLPPVRYPVAKRLGAIPTYAWAELGWWMRTKVLWRLRRAN